jgi:hypothetical protein
MDLSTSCHPAVVIAHYFRHATSTLANKQLEVDYRQPEPTVERINSILKAFEKGAKSSSAEMSRGEASTDRKTQVLQPIDQNAM